MAVKRKVHDVSPPPRPLCACGAEATKSVQLSVHRLKLDNDYRGGLEWTSGHAHTRIESVVCDDCASAKVQVDLSVKAELAQAREKEKFER